jgi:hypothetical protein
MGSDLNLVNSYTKFWFRFNMWKVLGIWKTILRVNFMGKNLGNDAVNIYILYSIRKYFYGHSKFNF